MPLMEERQMRQVGILAIELAKPSFRGKRVADPIWRS